MNGRIMAFARLVLVALVLSAGLAAAACGGGGADPEPTATRTPRPTLEPTPTYEREMTASPIASPPYDGAPSPTPGIQSEGPVLVRQSKTVLDGFALQSGMEVVQASPYRRFEAELESGAYSGAIFENTEAREQVVDLYDFVRRGGRAVLYGASKYATRPEVNAAFQEFFGLSFAYERIASASLSADGSSHTPLWQGLEVGFDSEVEYNVFLIPAAPYDCKYYTSESTNIDRCISAYRTLGSGEILILLGRDRAPWTHCEDASINTLDNLAACLELVKYLAGRIHYPK